MALYIAPIFTISKYLFNKVSEPVFENRLSRKYSGEALELKVKKSTRNGFKVLYFGLITLFGFYVFSDTEYQSPIMFGNGDIHHLYSDWPYNKMPQYFKLYYMIGLSYHLEVTIVHLFSSAQNDFYEMLLHHYITIMLIIGSFMTANWHSGINVLIQMDNGDCLGGLIKATMDFMPVPFVLVNYLGLLFSWIYFRIFAYTYEVIWKGSLTGRWHVDYTNSSQSVFQMLLVGLLILNVYWTILFFRMGYRFVNKGEIKDIQNPIEDKMKRDPAVKAK